MIRQSLEPDAACAYVAVHGDGLTSLQFRDSSGGLTREVQSSKGRPSRAALTRYGTTLFMSLAQGDGPPINSGAYTRVSFQDPVYVGLGICAHDDNAVETAWFRDVKLKSRDSVADAKPVLHCTLETIPIASKDRRAIYHTTNHIEAPNWTPDGKAFLFNSRGKIYRLPVGGGEPQVINTGFAIRCNNDHGISPDGTTLVISDQTRGGKSLIYTLPISGGEPRLITALGPSYWHGWSPDGATLAYCAERDGEYDVYTIPARGGDETRLTTAEGLDDGPDYSPDGKHIFFNSDRTGTMQIWRMNADGSDQQPWTKGELNDWFPHPSPDGKWIVFLSYEKDVKGHPANEPVRLRIMPAAGGEPQELARLFGGQGTINVPSWSPDSKQVAFVSYELLPE
jgi:Tol biopolymer transport system component